MRETTAADWTSANRRQQTSPRFTLNISKDNVQFGLRAIDKGRPPEPGRLPRR